MLIGLGGGAASSMGAGANIEDLDFASVQRDNAEMQRRCQEVIDRCWPLGADNPILSIHDVGAGGLSNALPELVHGAGRGARFDLRDDPERRAAACRRCEIWCNEAQERYVLAIAPREPGATSSALRARALPVRGAGHGHAPTAGWWSTTRSSATGRSTSTSTCCSASRRGCSAT